ncbi:MAG TPA: hypothetical protein GX719_05530 [Gammaproteobacteria bacterium]|nr:hypothetical protein [Gammaproteobacteria bacterium]
MRNSIKIILCLSVFLGSHAAVAANGDQLQQVSYQCERGVVLPVTFLNTANGGAYAVMQVEGQQIPMSIAVSASGARYTSIDEKRPYRLHTKGDTAILSWQSAAEPMNDAIVLKECATGAEMFAKNTQ